LPDRCNSSPVVAEGRVLVTCATDGGKVRGLYAFDRRDGRALWTQTVTYDREDPTHGTNPYCGSSPAVADGKVIVWHGSAGVHCYDLDGKPLWSRDLGEFRHIWGYGSSPVVVDGIVYLNCGPGPRQALYALDLGTGSTRWEHPIPGGESGDEPAADGKRAEWTGSWTTPVVTRIDDRLQLLVGLPKQMQSFDAATGEPLWSIAGLGPLFYTDVLVGDGMGVAMSGFHGPAIGFRLGGRGDMTEQNRLWHHTSRNPQRIGSGVIVGEHLFIANEIGVAQCLEVKTGVERWKERLPGGKLWGSMLSADGRLYVTNFDGTTLVLAPNPERLELLAENRLNEPSNSTPALSNGEIFLRTFKHLYCIGEMIATK
jgi:outer membrane protein assembly factor BamB